MITIFPFEKLGQHNYGWLNAHYHFNFANYYNPKTIGLSPFLVWNNDSIPLGMGFPMHSHRDKGITTFIREGSISHIESLGNKGVTNVGEIQNCQQVQALLTLSIIMEWKKHFYSKDGLNLIR